MCGVRGKVELDLDQFGKFNYPVPIRLRDLQAMVRPFMETKSRHHIHGLDAIIAELVRALLRLYHTVRAWDDTLMDQASPGALLRMGRQSGRRGCPVLSHHAPCSADRAVPQSVFHLSWISAIRYVYSVVPRLPMHHARLALCVGHGRTARFLG